MPALTAKALDLEKQFGATAARKSWRLLKNGQEKLSSDL